MTESPHPRESTSPGAEFNPEERAFLLDLARRALAESISGRQVQPESVAVSDHLREMRACFVTLFVDGQLRGCIGQVQPRMPLFEAVMRNACSAGLQDRRFEPITAGELPRLRVEISVLSPMERRAGTPDEILAQLRPLVDGVLLERHGGVVTFLPQVWEHIVSREEFMERLSEKAGWGKSAWCEPGTTVSIYRVESFESN
jgi:uncharacterized protein